MKNKGNFVAPAARLLCAVLLVCAWALYCGKPTFGQGGGGKETVTKVADNKYGEGGTHITFSDEKYRTTRELWMDKDGRIRQVIIYDKSGVNSETFTEYREKHSLGVLIEPNSDENRPDYPFKIHWGGPTHSDNKEYAKTLEQAEKSAKKILEQFAKDGTVIGPDGGVPTEVEKPPLPPADVLPSTKGREPKKAEPKPSPESGGNKNSPGKTSMPGGVKQDRKVSVGEAERRIGAHIKYIEQRAGEMAGAFYYSGARATLEAAFRKSGVTYSMTYADSWGTNGIGLAWPERAQQFYNYHHDVLTSYLSSVRARGFAMESDLDYYDAAMEDWKRWDQLIAKQFQSLVELFTKEALIFDEQHADTAKYYDRLHQLQAQQPYPSSQIDALNAEQGRKDKAFKERSDAVDVEIQKARDEISRLGGEHLFSVRK